MKLVKQGDHKPTEGTRREQIFTEAMEAWDLIQQEGETETLGAGEWEDDDEGTDDDEEEV